MDVAGQAVWTKAAMQVIYNELLQHTDSGAALGDPVAVFGNSALLAPRGRFDVELYLSFMKLTGQVQPQPQQEDRGGEGSGMASERRADNIRFELRCCKPTMAAMTAGNGYVVCWRTRV